ATFLLSSIVSLVTTLPPKDAMLNYTLRGPYLCLWASISILLGSIIVASTDVYVLAMCTPELLEQRMMSTRVRVWLVLILLAYPFFAVAVGVSCCILG
ncbi:hypothetical protein C8R45DRAFT_752794, partial [Mycena sanguinolenta]